MIKFQYKVTTNEGVVYEFKELCDSWKFADDNGLQRPARIMDKDNTMPYMRGPLYWFNNLRFWHNHEAGKIKYSQKAKDYYDNWLQEIYKNERVNTNLQNGLQ
jgi:G:T-mismatch repair DNA endonuclease (very short patch repair protein)